MVNYVRPVLSSPLKWGGMTGQAMLSCLWGWSQGKGIGRQEEGLSNFFCKNGGPHVKVFTCVMVTLFVVSQDGGNRELYISLVKRQWRSWVVTLQHAAPCVMILDSPIYIRLIIQLCSGHSLTSIHSILFLILHPAVFPKDITLLLGCDLKY